MIAILLAYLVTALIFIIYGKGFVLLIDKVNARNYDPFDAYFIGFAVAGTILNVWSLLLPADETSFLVLSGGALLLLFFFRKLYLGFLAENLNRLRNHKVYCIFIIFALAIVIGFAIRTPQLYDAYLYHINAMQWNYMYRAVPGLANLHDRFGFNSSAAVVGATFSFAEIAGQYLFVINSLTFFVFFCWLLKKALTGNAMLRIFLVLFMYYFTATYSEHISSPGTDLLPNVFVAYVLLTLISEQESLHQKRMIFIALPLFCVTFKISVLPIVILTLPAIYLKHRKLAKGVLELIIYGSIFLLPWLIRNVVLTGYLMYPVAAIDLFNVDWKVSEHSIIEIKNAVYSWSRIPSAPYEQILAMSFQEWFSVWWDAKTAVQQVFLSLAAAAPILFGIFGIYNYKVSKVANTNLFLALFTSYCCFLLWFITAPDMRFSYTVILILAFSPILILDHLLPEVGRSFKYATLACVMGLFAFIGIESYTGFKAELKSKNSPNFMLLPIDVSTLKHKRAREFIQVRYLTPGRKKIRFYAPSISHSQCFDKFPCSSRYLPDFKLRGEDLQDGFYNADRQ